jgi:hypothetical protein
LINQDAGVRIWILTPAEEEPLYYLVKEHAEAQMQKDCAGLRGEWVERNLSDEIVEWAFYELDEMGELVQVLRWALAESILITEDECLP